ncbi:hypothetical protein BJV74DRAFT_826642, partial [Russula compacta]
GNIEVHSPLLPDTSIFRLHGSPPLATRRSSLRAFSPSQKAPKVGHAGSVLLCTSVAARGLDLPLVRTVAAQRNTYTASDAPHARVVVGRHGQSSHRVRNNVLNGCRHEASEAAEGGVGHFEVVAVEEFSRRDSVGKVRSMRIAGPRFS